MKIAVDSPISNKTVKFLEDFGYECVYKAGFAESDAKWFHKAKAKGATVFISNDSDIARIVNECSLEEQIFWIDVKSEKVDVVNNILLLKLNKLKKTWNLNNGNFFKFLKGK